MDILILAVGALCFAIIVALILHRRNQTQEPYVPGYIISTGLPGEARRKSVAQERLNEWLDTLPSERKRVYRKQQLTALTRRGWRVVVEAEVLPSKAIQYRAKCFDPSGMLVKEAVGKYPEDAQLEALP